jgi:dihydroorotate dehydrogenase
LIRETRKNWRDRFTIIGCGGILSASDAMEKLDAGADILQLITGMIFEGPHLMKNICEAYAKRMANLPILLYKNRENKETGYKI